MSIFAKHQILPLLLLAVAVFLLPEAGFAGGGGGGGGPIETVLCEIVSWFKGYVGRGIASLAIIVMGILALFGKLQPGMAMVTITGIIIMFSAAEIVDAMGIDAAGVCPDVIGGNNQIAEILCNIAAWFKGTTGQAFATIGMVMLGVGALFGKLSPAQALSVIIGIVFIFGFTEILVNNIGVTEGGCANIPISGPPSGI